MSLSAAIDQFNKTATKLAETEFKVRVLRLQNDAVNNTPVDTGRLRAGWLGDFSRARGELSFLLQNPVEYAVHVEEGTDKMRPRRMLARAILSAVRQR